jgi:O-antigen/teichoic acid export membrane protein
MIFKQIIGTSIGKLIATLSSFAMVVLSAHYIGAEGVGKVSLVLLGITLIHLVSNCVGGPAIVYLLPRHKLIQLVVPSAIWTAICSFCGSFLLSFFNLIPKDHTLDLLFLSFLVAINSMNLNVLLGKERIKSFNFISTLQTVISLLVLFIEFVLLHHHSIHAYLLAYYTGVISSLLLSMLLIIPFLKFEKSIFQRDVLNDLVKYSPIMQISTFSQMLNYRLSYYFIEFFYGTAALGVFSVATQVAESVWIISRSFATIHYTHVSNQGDNTESRNLTHLLMKMVGLITMFLLIVMVLLPGGVYDFLFGHGFSFARSIVAILAPGMLFTGISMILSHYFSGIGLPVKSMIGSLIGLVITLLMGMFLISRLGLEGAAITTSTSYFVGLVYLIFAFKKHCKIIEGRN